jgi:hypothetical protein
MVHNFGKIILCKKLQKSAVFPHLSHSQICDSLELSGAPRDSIVFNYICLITLQNIFIVLFVSRLITLKPTGSTFCITAINPKFYLPT